MFVVGLELMSVLKWILTPLAQILPYIYELPRMDFSWMAKTRFANYELILFLTHCL